MTLKLSTICFGGYLGVPKGLIVNTKSSLSLPSEKITRGITEKIPGRSGFKGIWSTFKIQTCFNHFVGSRSGSQYSPRGGCVPRNASDRFLVGEGSVVITVARGGSGQLCASPRFGLFRFLQPGARGGIVTIVPVQLCNVIHCVHCSFSEGTLRQNGFIGRGETQKWLIETCPLMWRRDATTVFIL